MSETAYDPANYAHRKALAAAIEKVVLDAGFVEEFVEPQGVHERVFYRTMPDSDNRILIRVYTSIVGEAVRGEGKDAIRVAATYRTKRDDKTRGIGSETRINRTGTIEGVCERLLTRMRSVYKNTLPKYRKTCNCCGAPTFRSKKGNDVCAELCFKDREGYVEKPFTPTYKRRSTPRRRRAPFAHRRF